MSLHYLLSCSGEDKKGIVAAVTDVLLRQGCNLEDSSMMKLGSEFAIFLILSSRKPISEQAFSSLKNKWKLSVSLKKITAHQARFQASNRQLYLVAVHGPDKPGIVNRVTTNLAKNGFNITDLATHRTQGGKTPGFILFIEGEIKGKSVGPVKKGLQSLQKSLGTIITLNPVSAQRI